PRLGRRAFLGALGGGALASLLPLKGGSGLLDPAALADPPPGAPPGGRPFEAQLPIPRQLRGSRIEIPMRQAEVGVVPGPKTRMWTYDGTFPGPTVRRPAGHRTEVTFRHELPAEAGEMSVHLHGGHSRSEYDGQPGGLTASHPHSLFCEIPRNL